MRLLFLLGLFLAIITFVDAVAIPDLVPRQRGRRTSTSTSTRTSTSSTRTSTSSKRTTSTSSTRTSSSTRATSTSSTRTSSTTRRTSSTSSTRTSSTSSRRTSTSTSTSQTRSTSSTRTSTTSSAPTATATSGKYVIAHYMMGVAASYSTSEFQDDMSKAQAAGIDAFGLNIAAQDPNTQTTVAKMFTAAESLSGRSIQLFLNFDYAAWGTWDATTVTTLINKYKTSAVYFKYQGKPFVSTFEGPGNAGDWTGIKSSTGCFFIPDYSSVGASTAASYSAIDGLASWNAWPEGANNLTTGDDQWYVSNLKGKPYMMPVSPWFYTNLPQYSKNWLWHSDSLFHYRWLQAISMAPNFVQIISWNDYGESHYIGPIRSSGVVPGAWYVDSAHSHDGWLALLPKYIAAYKAGSTAPLTAAGSDKLVYWYKTNPINSGSTGDTTGNNPGYQTTHPPGDLSKDLIFFTAQLSAPADISVTIGGNSPQQVYAGSAGITHFSVPIPDSQTGSVVFKVIRYGSTVMTTTGSQPIGAPSSASPVNGMVNWNPVVGSS